MRYAAIASAAIISAIAESCGASSVRTGSRPLWLLLDEDKRVWCGYADENAFQMDANRLKPLESARVTPARNRVYKITYQVQPESGDWINADQYTFAGDRVVLKRVTIYTQSQIETTQLGSFKSTGLSPSLRLVHVTSLSKARIPTEAPLDPPAIPVKRSLNDFAFMGIINSMKDGHLKKICK